MTPELLILNECMNCCYGCTQPPKLLESQRFWEQLLTLLLLPLQLSGGCELTVVIHDFVAGNGSSGELSVRRGQTVEVLERLHDKPDWCLVRTTDRSPAQEGIVPCSMLCIAHSRSSMEMEGLFNHKGRRIAFLGFTL